MISSNINVINCLCYSSKILLRFWNQYEIIHIIYIKITLLVSKQSSQHSVHNHIKLNEAVFITKVHKNCVLIFSIENIYHLATYIFSKGLLWKHFESSSSSSDRNSPLLGIGRGRGQSTAQVVHEREDFVWRPIENTINVTHSFPRMS